MPSGCSARPAGREQWSSSLPRPEMRQTASSGVSLCAIRALPSFLLHANRRTTATRRSRIAAPLASARTMKTTPLLRSSGQGPAAAARTQERWVRRTRHARMGCRMTTPGTRQLASFSLGRYCHRHVRAGGMLLTLSLGCACSFTWQPDLRLSARQLLGHVDQELYEPAG